MGPAAVRGGPRPVDSLAGGWGDRLGVMHTPAGELPGPVADRLAQAGVGRERAAVTRRNTVEARGWPVEGSGRFQDALIAAESGAPEVDGPGPAGRAPVPAGGKPGPGAALRRDHTWGRTGLPGSGHFRSGRKTWAPPDLQVLDLRLNPGPALEVSQSLDRATMVQSSLLYRKTNSNQKQTFKNIGSVSGAVICFNLVRSPGA